MKRLIFTVVAFAALFSCVKNEEIDYTVDSQESDWVFVCEKPSIEENGTKTSWTGSKVEWSVGDQIRIACYNFKSEKWQDQNGDATKSPKAYASNLLPANNIVDGVASFSFSTKFKMPEGGNYRFYSISPKAITDTDITDAPVISTSIDNVQPISSASFDGTSDIMVGISTNSYTSQPSEYDKIELKWKRLVAFPVITFKSLNGAVAGEIVQSVKLTAQEGAVLTGAVDVNIVDGTITASTERETYNEVAATSTSGVALDANNSFTSWFTTLPFTATSLNVEIVTDKATYTREIDLSANNKQFECNKRNLLTINMSSATRTVGEEDDDNTPTTVIFDNLGYESWGKSASFSGTDFNSVSQEKDGVSFTYFRKDGSLYANTTAIRLYKTNELVFAAPDGFVITSIEFEGSSFKDDVFTDVPTCTSNSSALSWKGKAASVTFTRPSNASSYANLSKVTVIIEPGVSEIYYNIVVPNDVTGGTISSSLSKATSGTDVTLTATPNIGYKFNNDWSVVDADGNSVSVANGKFTMPASNVSVSGSFKLLPVSFPYSEDFASSIGAFTIDNVTLASEISYVWNYDASHDQMKASAFVNSTNYASESWLISPVIDLTSAVSPVLEFDHTYRFTTNPSDHLTLWAREEGGSWAQLQIANYGSADTWDFVTNTIDVSSYAGKTLQFAFKYVSSSSAAATWEVTNISVKEYGEDVSEPEQLQMTTVSCTEQTETSLTFSWDAVANAEGYQVKVGNGTYGETQTATSVTVSGLSAGTQYTIYVKAIGDGDEYTDSEPVSAIGTTKSAGGSGDGGETVTKTLIIDGSVLTSTTTTATADYTFDGITVTMSEGAKVQSSTGTNKFTANAILIGKSGKYIYNKTPIPGKITKFEIYANKGASAKVSVGVLFSDSSISAYSTGNNTYTATLSTVDNVYDCSSKLTSNCKYFWYQVTNANNSQVEFRITYETTK